MSEQRPTPSALDAERKPVIEPGEESYMQSRIDAAIKGWFRVD